MLPAHPATTIHLNPVDKPADSMAPADRLPGVRLQFQGFRGRCTVVWGIIRFPRAFIPPDGPSAETALAGNVQMLLDQGLVRARGHPPRTLEREVYRCPSTKASLLIRGIVSIEVFFLESERTKPPTHPRSGPWPRVSLTVTHPDQSRFCGRAFAEPALRQPAVWATQPFHQDFATPSSKLTGELSNPALHRPNLGGAPPAGPGAFGCILNKKSF